MAKQSIDTAAQAAGIISDVKNRIFKPVYVLMGEEPYYPDMVCEAIVENALEEWERDFNETICYGSDVTAETVITAARRYPMMADRQLIVVKDAQLMKTVEQLSVYLESPLDSTVLVLLFRNATLDKRKSLYKSAAKQGIVLESNPVRDYEIARWISSYYSSRGLAIDYPAAQLLGEYAGTNLGAIVSETDKLLKSIPEGETRIRVEDIEKNVGISREFSIFELTRALSLKDARKALTLSAHIGNGAKFAMPAAVSGLFMHFGRILKYEAFLMKNPRASEDERARVVGVYRSFLGEYDAAVRNYPVPKTMAIVSLLADYDLKSKGGAAQEVPDSALLIELVSRILTI